MVQCPVGEIFGICFSKKKKKSLFGCSRNRLENLKSRNNQKVDVRKSRELFYEELEDEVDCGVLGRSHIIVGKGKWSIFHF